MKDRAEANQKRWNIRRIKAGSKALKQYCGHMACLQLAKYYLVRLPAEPMEKAESRVRRCYTHALLEARELGISFPNPSRPPGGRRQA